jgi:hypothetical protein
VPTQKKQTAYKRVFCVPVALPPRRAHAKKHARVLRIGWATGTLNTSFWCGCAVLVAAVVKFCVFGSLARVQGASQFLLCAPRRLDGGPQVADSIFLCGRSSLTGHKTLAAQCHRDTNYARVAARCLNEVILGLIHYGYFLLAFFSFAGVDFG